ncbi:MAG: hypothetical protein HZB61_05825 [Nitrospirae bacterium]|nr:hypothetical protein [Nitrospirota bacterium]
MSKSIVVFALAVSVLASYFTPAAAYSYYGEWEAAATLSVARYQFTGGVINGKIYVFGGRGSSNLRSVEMYNPETDKWSSQESNQTAVAELSGAVVNDKLYVFGALSGSPSAILNFVQEYDPATDAWTLKAAKPAAVSSAPAVVYKGEIYLFGGKSNTVPETYSDVVEAYNPSTDTWRLVAHMPMLINNMAVSVAGPKAYLIGGIDHISNNAVVEVIAYDFDSDTWTTSGMGALSLPRGFPCSSSAPVLDGKIHLIGGWTAAKWTGLAGADIVPTGDFQIYDTATNTFSTEIPLPYPTVDHMAVFLNNAFYVIGGKAKDIEINRTNSVWKLDLPCNDKDGDGYGDPGGDNCVNGPTVDCNDNDPEISPAAKEGPFGNATCSDSIDNNCDGVTDESDLGCAEVTGNESPGDAGETAGTGESTSGKDGRSAPNEGPGDCFIATAAYGSYLADEVMELREFRDKHLLTNPLGRAFVIDFYYRYSPPAADYISQHKSLKAVTRVMLTPVVYSIKYPFLTASILTICGLATFRRHRKNQG